MKLSEMSSARAFECMARMVPHVAAIERDPEVAAARQRMLDRGLEEATMGDVIDAVMPVILERHAEAVFGIVGALEGKTPAQIAGQPCAKTIAAMREGLTQEFFDFLSFASRLVMSA